MARDPLRGAIFENLVITDVIKQRYNRGQDPSVFFFRDCHHTEVDLIVKKGHQLTAMEIKSSAAEEDINESGSRTG